MLYDIHLVQSMFHIFKTDFKTFNVCPIVVYILDRPCQLNCNMKSVCRREEEEVANGAQLQIVLTLFN